MESHDLDMMLDPSNHTRWKHKWRWHNRGCVWDKTTSERSGVEDWSEKKKNARMQWTSGFRHAMMNVKLSVMHRPKIGESVKPSTERKEPIKFGPLDLLIALRSEGTTVQLCGHSNVAERWINGYHAMGKRSPRQKWFWQIMGTEGQHFKNN